MSRRHASRSRHFARIMRSGVARWLAVMVVAPLVALGGLGGARLLVHSHDDHVHLHALQQDRNVPDAPHDHHPETRDASTPTTPRDGAGIDGSAPMGAVIALPDDERMPPRAFDLGELAAVELAVPFFLAPSSTDVARRIVSSGEPPGDRRRDLHALSAGDRLVRISRALLI